MFVTDPPHISQFKIGKYANHNGYVDFLTDLTETVWDKRVACKISLVTQWCVPFVMTLQYSDEWNLILTDGYIKLVAKVYFLGVNYEMFTGYMQ